jgi:pimeloyl-ACP methyl ester carboxylesterase
MRANSLLTTLLAIPLAACSAVSNSPSEAAESYIQTPDGTLLYYKRIGNGPDTVYVPSGSWMSEDLDELAREHTLIFFDMRGRGRSNPARATNPPNLTSDVEDFETVRAWFGTERFSILAIDYHAAVAAHYALRHPERVEKLVLVSPIPPRKTPYLAIYERVFDDRLDQDTLLELRKKRSEYVRQQDHTAWATAYKEALFPAWVADAKSLEDMQSSPFVKPNDNPEHLIRQYLEMVRGLGEWDWRADLSRVTAPALVVYGKVDPTPAESSEEWAAALANGRSYAVDDCGRLPWVEKPREFTKVVDGFLAE